MISSTFINIYVIAIDWYANLWSYTLTNTWTVISEVSTVTFTVIWSQIIHTQLITIISIQVTLINICKCDMKEIKLSTQLERYNYFLFYTYIHSYICTYVPWLQFLPVHWEGHVQTSGAVQFPPLKQPVEHTAVCTYISIQ